LKGNLGSGKTTFARFFIEEIAKKNNKKIKCPIISPTYNLINNYDFGKNLKICHADLYRIKNINEIIEIGLYEEMENRISLIEWPEKISKIFKERIDIFFLKKKTIDKIDLSIKFFGMKSFLIKRI
tara:strand:- start:10725 stop:11102 length:378 start_codon:yes stop_codon:yes gene_type:complete